MKLNDDASAMNYLNLYQKMTTQQQSNQETMLSQKADAEKHMANLLWKKGERTNAIRYFNDFFNDAKADKHSTGRRVLDTARIANGLAKGTSSIDSYIEAILSSKDDACSLVEWKQPKDKK